jgi:hypothetical protein
MKKIKCLAITFVVFTFLMGFGKQSRGQVFYIGINGGAVYTWFNSPKLENIITSDGAGWDLGFFLRYGKRPYFQLGFDWTRSMNEITIHIDDQPSIINNIPFHNFDFSLKVGYEFIQLPMFKLKAHAGPFIGRSMLLSNDDLLFEKDDFRNPQWGVIAGLGFQFTNFVVDLEYSYHFSDLFKPVYINDKEYKLGSNLQIVTLKLGFMF